jgi:hypothetical protein
MTDGTNDLDLPFEEGPPGQTMPLGDGHIAAGMVVIAGVVPVGDRGLMPCLIYRFANPDGSGFYPEMVLIVDDEQMLKLAQLIVAASTAAVRGAAAGRRGQ